MKGNFVVYLIVWFSGVAALLHGQAYDIYAIQFGGPFHLPADQIAVNGSDQDTVGACYMIWFLAGDHGRNVLVDVGFSDTAKYKTSNFIRPDMALQRLNVRAEDITDIIISHPHWDHIGGIDLFPNGRVWMQKDDYEYFVGAAWQDQGFSDGFDRSDVHKLVDVNLQGRLTFVEGDEVEIIPGITVFVGSKHTFESQYVLATSKKENQKVVIASDNIWFYYNLESLLPIPHYTFDPDGYVRQMKRMKTLATSEHLIVPGHDVLVFSRFPEIAPGIVKIEGQ